MQRLTAIDQRRRELLATLEDLNREEQEIRSTLNSAAVNPTVLSAIQGAKTQQGCSEAQALLESADAELRSAILSATLAELRTVIVDPYGALFLQKMLETADTAELRRFQNALARGSLFVDAASSAAGSRVLQRFLDLCGIDADVAAGYSDLLCRNIVGLSNNSNACHVIQRGLTSKSFADKGPFVSALVREIFPIATDKQGCCVVQRAIDWLPEPYCETLIAVIISNEVQLVQDAFGNYVVQHLLERQDDALTRRVVGPLLHNIAALACNKFSSNVVEKCVRTSKTAVRQLLIDELTDPAVLSRLVQDSYANYVIQTAIAASSDEQFQQLHAAIRPCFNVLKNSPYGVKIDAKIQRRLKDNARAKQRKRKQEMNAAENSGVEVKEGAPEELVVEGSQGTRNRSGKGGRGQQHQHQQVAGYMPQHGHHHHHHHLAHHHHHHHQQIFQQAPPQHVFGHYGVTATPVSIPMGHPSAPQ